MEEENVTVDVEAESVIESEEEIKITYQQRKSMEKARITAINKMLKDHKRREKNPLNIIRNMDK